MIVDLIKTLYKKLYENKKTDLSKGFNIGMYDYLKLLKVTEDKVKVDKIILLMETCHYLTDELDLGRIEETHN